MGTRLPHNITHKSFFPNLRDISREHIILCCCTKTKKSIICPAFYSELKQALSSLKGDTKTNKKEALQPVATKKPSFKAIFHILYKIDDKAKCLYLTPGSIGRLSLTAKYMGFSRRIALCR